MVNCHYTLGEYMMDNKIDLPEDQKWIKGYEWEYAICKEGYVVSYKNKEPRRLKGGVGYIKSRNTSGYFLVALAKRGIKGSKTFTCHRLVAEHFIPNPENKPCVNHIDGDKLNNNVDNLEWVTHSENTIHAYKTGLATPNFVDHTRNIDNFINNGELNGYNSIYLKGLITPEDLERNGLPVDLIAVNFVYDGRSLKETWYDNCKIYRMIEEGYRVSEIAKITGKSLGTISRIKRKSIHVEAYEIYKKLLTEEDKAAILDIRKINERKQLLNLKEIRPCEHCGILMPEERTHKKFCSNSCYHKFNKNA